MKSSARIAGGLAVIAVAVLMPACSSTPAHPPLETGGSKSPAVGAGGGAAPTDGGSTSDDGGAAVLASEDGGGGVAVDGGLCSSNCGGCCDTLNLCHPGGQNTACGQLGAPCSICQTGTTCNGASCQ